MKRATEQAEMHAEKSELKSCQWARVKSCLVKEAITPEVAVDSTVWEGCSKD